MPIIKQHRIYRQDLQNNPNVIYIFGDNLERVGMGGQAAEMRGEPNAFGIPTKRTPGHSPGDYFGDPENRMSELIVIIQHFNWVEKMLKDSRTVIWPSDGIGTGLSKLPEVYPELAEDIEFYVESLFQEYGVTS